MRLAWAIAAGIFFVDFLVKTYLRTNISQNSIPIIKNIFHITLVRNSGAAFGILKDKTTFLIYICIAFILCFFFFIRKEAKKNPLFLIACGLILGGALSNLYDRIFLGFVVDYIDLRIWPVFNISDSCITIGAALLFFDSFKKDHAKRINCFL